MLKKQSIKANFKQVWEKRTRKSRAGVKYTYYVSVLEGTPNIGKNRKQRRFEGRITKRIMRKLSKKEQNG